MPSFSIVKAANAASKPSYRPVALVLGGTSGIGQVRRSPFASLSLLIVATSQAIVETLAKYTDGNVHIIICGRNQASAEAIIAKLYKGPGNSSTYEFLHCDVSLVKNVKKACTELLSRVPKLNYLVLSSGALSLTGRVDSEEGIDNRMALTFYSRFEFVDQLLPLLKNAKAAGEDARVLSILAAGNGGPIDFQDLALKKKYTIPLSMTVPATYNDLMVEVRSFPLFASAKTNAAFRRNTRRATPISRLFTFTPVWSALRYMVIHTGYCAS
jgi:NAD(P)-dependent dehydrogenase (short-subunit alcohol dehydrogenase family)